MSVEIDSIIFDLDGTLWNATPTVAKARNNVFKNLGIQHEPTNAMDVARTVGLPVDEVYKQIFPSVSSEYLHKLIKNVSIEIDRLLRLEGAVIYPGVKEGLEKLKNKYQLFIVSNCDKGYIETFFDWSKLDLLFNDFECYGKTRCSKTDNT